MSITRVFDSLHCKVLQSLLQLCGIPAMTVGLLTGLHLRTETNVTWGGWMAVFFPVCVVCQWCILAPPIFNACMDQSSLGVSIGNTMVNDLVFSDDVILCESLDALVLDLVALHEGAKSLGL